MFHRTSYAVTARLNIEMGSTICETNLDTMLHREHWLSFTIFWAVSLAQYNSHIILQQNKLKLHKNVGMASQTLRKQSRDDIKVKINVQSPIPGSQSASWCHTSGLLANDKVFSRATSDCGWQDWRRAASEQVNTDFDCLSF